MEVNEVNTVALCVVNQGVERSPGWGGRWKRGFRRGLLGERQENERVCLYCLSLSFCSLYAIGLRAEGTR